MSKNRKKFLILFSVSIVLIVIVLITYNIYGINYFHNLYKFQIDYVILTSGIFIYLVTVIILGSIIGWPIIFSIIKKPSSFKQKLANQYVLFLVSILNHERIPNRFIFFTVTLGAFLGRRLVWFMSIAYPKSLLLIFFSPFLFFFLSFILLYGYFILSVKYPKIFGKYLINFFEKNASEEILTLIGLKKSSSIKKS